MSGQDDPYVRVYYRVITDPRFEAIYSDARALGTWLQLLLYADAMYPAPAPLPTYIHRPSLKALVDAGIIELGKHSHYVVHGLASEREMRAHSARNAAAKRWHSNGNADPMLAEPSLAKPNRAYGSQSDRNVDKSFDRRVEATQREIKTFTRGNE